MNTCNGNKSVLGTYGLQKLQNLKIDIGIKSKKKPAEDESVGFLNLLLMVLERSPFGLFAFNTFE
jgi:hypothetical protein